MLDSPTSLLAVVSCAWLLCCGSTLAAAPRAIHPAVRAAAAPAGDAEVAVNPPPLLWPASPRRDARYAVRLSQDPDFADGETIAAADLPWAVFNAHTKLAPGKWRWQYGVAVKGKTTWSEAMSFRITDAAREFVTPPAAAMLAACPESHPRVLMTAEQLPAFRERVAKDPEAQRIVRAARRFVDAPLRSEDSGRPKKKGKNKAQAKKFATWASKGLGGKMKGAATALAKAYLITGEERFGRGAVRVATHVAGFDVQGVTSRKVSDFADGACLEAMTVVYDSCYDLLSDDDKAALRKAIKARAGRMFGSWRNRLETRVFSAHIWQHILHQFAEAAFATLGEIPEAELWATYVYEIWIARVPLQGGSDGGWANGNNYFGTNYSTLIYIPTFFRRLTGVSFFDHPWYQNTPYYLLYTWPPRSCNDGFGDGYDRRGMPPTSRVGFADVLSRETKSPVAAWYVNACLGGKRDLLTRDKTFTWYRLQAGAEQGPPAVPTSLDLPQGRAFKDIGVVAMHTDLGNTDKNLMVALRSSPYGSFNHAHADQNAFNVLFAGQPLFYSSGYYIAYGDDHFKEWYKHSRGHNTVLIDGKGQEFGPEGYGWIARYLDGRRVTYCLGDASRAYGRAGLKRYRRHLALLRPSTVVVYDELEADHSAQWTWLLHSPSAMSVEGQQKLVGATGAAAARVDVMGSVPLRIEVDDRFDPPADNWRGVKERDGSIKQYANQWHARVDATQKLKRMRYLAVVQIAPSGEDAGVKDVVRREDGWLTVGQWRIRAELDASKPASLEVRSADGSTTLAADAPATDVGGKPRPVGCASVLAETEAGESTIQTSEDQLPGGAM